MTKNTNQEATSNGGKKRSQNSVKNLETKVIIKIKHHVNGN
jgi:hypothetical protein